MLKLFCQLVDFLIGAWQVLVEMLELADDMFNFAGTNVAGRKTKHVVLL
jgi:hypothetical protein